MRLLAALGNCSCVTLITYILVGMHCPDTSHPCNYDVVQYTLHPWRYGASLVCRLLTSSISMETGIKLYCFHLFEGFLHDLAIYFFRFIFIFLSQCHLKDADTMTDLVPILSSHCGSCVNRSSRILLRAKRGNNAANNS